MNVNGHVDGAGKKLPDAYFTRQSPESNEQRQITRPALFKVFLYRKVLQCGRLSPAPDNAFIGFVNGVFEIEQRDQPDRQTGSSSAGEHSADNRRHATKQTNALNSPSLADLPGKALRDGCSNFLPGRAEGKHRQRVAQFGHLI